MNQRRIIYACISFAQSIPIDLKNDFLLVLRECLRNVFLNDLTSRIVRMGDKAQEDALNENLGDFFDCLAAVEPNKEG